MSNKNEGKKTEVIVVKFTTKEKERLQRIAMEKGKSTSEYIREQLEKTICKEDKEFTREVKHIIRQIQTLKNMQNAGIDIEKQGMKIMEGVEELCALLK